MQAGTAAEVSTAWADAFRARDLDALMELFEPDAVWISETGDVVSGLDGIRGVFADFLALDPEFEAEEQQVFQAGDVALLQFRWTVRGTTPEGEETVASGRTADVVRRRPDGSWRYVIDSPFGGAG